MQTPQLYARNAVRTSVNFAVDEAGCSIAACVLFALLLLCHLHVTCNQWFAVARDQQVMHASDRNITSISIFIVHDCQAALSSASTMALVCVMSGAQVCS
jgi:hypothetical protein